MGRRFIAYLACCVAIATAVQTAQAGDRKTSAARGRNAAAEVNLRHDAQALALERDLFTPSAVKPARRSALFNDGSIESDTGAVAGRRKSLTLLRFDTMLGEVAVQPVFGAAKGAQFSLGF